MSDRETREGVFPERYRISRNRVKQRPSIYSRRVESVRSWIERLAFIESLNSCYNGVEGASHVPATRRFQVFKEHEKYSRLVDPGASDLRRSNKGGIHGKEKFVIVNRVSIRGSG